MSVDDESDIGFLTKEFLGTSGYLKVDITGSVAEARGAIAHRRYDVIVSDYQMPGEDGIQFLKSLRASGDMTPFILFTGKGREDVVIEAINNGADAYLQKGGDPISLYAELEHRVGTIVRRHRAESALLDSESEFRTLFENSPDAVILVSTDGRILNCNQAGARMVLMSKEEMVGAKISDLGVLSEDDLGLFQRTMIAMAQGEAVSPIVSRVHRKDNTERWMEIRASLVMKSGRCDAFQIIGRDVTEQKKAEEKMQRQSAVLSILNGIISMANKADDLSQLLDNILMESLRLLDYDAGGVYLVDSSTRTATVVCSKNLSRELLAEIQIVPIDQKPYDTLFIRNESIIAENYAQINPGRSQIYGIQSMASIPLLSKGEVIGAMNIASYRRCLISEEDKQILISIGRELGSTIKRMLSEEESKKTAKNFEIIFNSVDDMVFVQDIQGHILAVNDAVQRLLSYLPGELIGTDVMLLRVPERRAEALHNVQGMLDGTVVSCPVPFLAKDGKLLEVETKVTCGWWNDQEALIGVSRDVTERKDFDSRIRRLNRELVAIKECDRALVKASSENEMLDKVCRIVCDVAGYRLAWIGMAQNDEEKSVRPVAWSGFYEEYIKNIRATWAEDERGCGPTGTAIKTRRTVFIQDFANDIRMGPWRESALNIGIRSSIAIPLLDRGSILGAFTLYSDRINGFTDDEVELLEEMAMDMAFGIAGLRAHVERVKVEEALRETNRKLNLLSSITRHDITNQLMILSGHLSMLGGKLADPSFDDHLLKAKTSTNRIERMIEFTKTYDDIGLNEPTWYDLRKLISDVQAEFLTNRIKVSVEIPHGIEVLADPLLSKVISNLIDNAIRHGGSARNIHFSSNTVDGDLLIFCEDDGGGVAPDDKQKIFSKGYGKNTGMGLFLSREILGITKIGIRECGVQGKGTRFEIRVPKVAYRVNG
ncbi:MAG: GAF domain-containing protein [Methanomassiliicoccales archaeon]